MDMIHVSFPKFRVALIVNKASLLAHLEWCHVVMLRRRVVVVVVISRRGIIVVPPLLSYVPTYQKRDAEWEGKESAR